MRVSFSVMAHPTRERYFEYLQRELHIGPEHFAVDTDGRGIWKNCRAAWLLHDPSADYHFVIQDDAIIGKNFHERVQRTVERGEYVYNLYCSRPRLRRKVLSCKAQGLDHFIAEHIYHEIALGLPVKYIHEMIAYCDALNPEHDRYINSFIRSKGLQVYFPLPSPVDHRAEGSLHTFNRGSYKPVAIWHE